MANSLLSPQASLLPKAKHLDSFGSRSLKSLKNVGFVSCQTFGSSKPLLAGKTTISHTYHSVGITRCEASIEKSNSLDIWLGRVAMVGFVSVVAVEVATGKGVLENVGLVAPLPTVALALTAVVGAVTAFGVFRSANDS